MRHRVGAQASLGTPRWGPGCHTKKGRDAVLHNTGPTASPNGLGQGRSQLGSARVGQAQDTSSKGPLACH